MTREEAIVGPAKLEVLSPQIILNWDPVTDLGNVNFKLCKYLVVDGAIRNDVPPTPIGMLTQSLNDIMLRRFVPAGLVDPVTGADLSQISVAGVMTIIKAAFNTLYLEVNAPSPPEQPQEEPPAEEPPVEEPAP